MEYKNLNVKFHFWDRVIYNDEQYIVVAYNDKDWLYQIYKDWERKREWSLFKDDSTYKFWHTTKVSERVIKRDYQWEMKEELEVMDMSNDVIKAHKKLLDKINTNKKWYNKIFN